LIWIKFGTSAPPRLFRDEANPRQARVWSDLGSLWAGVGTLGTKSHTGNRQNSREISENTAAHTQHPGNFVTALMVVIERFATPPHCARIPTLHRNAQLSVRSEGDTVCSCKDLRRISVVKMLIATAATLALVTVASAADLPRPQPAPAYTEAPVIGKAPIGKSPVGKAPYGKGPVTARY
jgi:hypothetical protein